MSRQSRPSARVRGRARRRLRYLRQLRELQLRDLGGFVYDLYRFGERREEIVRAKLDALIVTDKEVGALEELLGAPPSRRLEVRAPGIGGTCPACGAFHAADARFCASCGTAVGAGEPAEAAPAGGGEPSAATPLPEAAGDPHTAVFHPLGDAPPDGGSMPPQAPATGEHASSNGSAADATDPATGEVAAVGREPRRDADA